MISWKQSPQTTHPLLRMRLGPPFHHQGGGQSVSHHLTGTRHCARVRGTTEWAVLFWGGAKEDEGGSQRGSPGKRSSPRAPLLPHCPLTSPLMLSALATAASWLCLQPSRRAPASGPLHRPASAWPVLFTNGSLFSRSSIPSR